MCKFYKVYICAVVGVIIEHQLGHLLGYNYKILFQNWIGRFTSRQQQVIQNRILDPTNEIMTHVACLQKAKLNLSAVNIFAAGLRNRYVL